jgi:hypothetical protein
LQTPSGMENIHRERLHGEIFAPAISAFTTFLWIMPDLRSHGWQWHYLT